MNADSVSAATIAVDNEQTQEKVNTSTNRADDPQYLELAAQIAADPLRYLPTKSTTWTMWQEAIGLAQITKMRGNFWKKYGFSINNINFLYPEEMLCLVEKKTIVVTRQVTTPQSLSDLLGKDELFEKATKFVPLPIYLCYAKLKSLDYIVLRHKKSVRMFADDAELYGIDYRSY